MQNVTRFDVQRRQLTRWFYIQYLIVIAALALSLAFIPLIILLEGGGLKPILIVTGIFALPLVALAVYGRWHSPRYVRSLEYWIEGGLLRVNQGVFIWKRTSVPLDRVTDVVLVQGIVMRALGVWTMRVQTAGDGAGAAEATMHGIGNAEEARIQLLAARKALLKNS